MDTPKLTCQEVLHRVPDWVYWTDPTGNVIDVSPACHSISGYAAAEFRANPRLLLSIVHPDDRKWMNAYLEGAKDVDDQKELEFRIFRRDGELRWIGGTLRRLIDNDGCLLGLCGVNRDITARKRRELETLQRSILLEQDCDEAAGLIQQQATQLRMLNWQRCQVEQHERRNLAQALHDHLQQLLVAARLKLAKLERYVSEESARQLVQQVAGLLSDGIAETRSLTCRLAPPVVYETGLSASLAWLAEYMKRQFSLHVEWAVEKGAEPEADDTRALLFLAVREMLFNVVKHAGVAIAHVVATAAENEMVRVVVSDAGNGFVPPPPASLGMSAAGFGLANIYQRLELLGGRVEIDSAPGQGTRITILAPCRPLPQPGK